MKRGTIVFTHELLLKKLRNIIPDDFLVAGTEYDASIGSIKIHGYSDKFHEVLEGNTQQNEGYVEEDLCQAHLIKLSRNLNHTTVYDEKKNNLQIEVK